MGDLLIIRLVAKAFPLRTPSEFVGLDLAALKAKYRKRDFANLVAFLMIAPVSVYLCHDWLVGYARRLAPHAGTVYHLSADTNFWFVPASFFGVVAACLLIHLGNRLLLPDGGREYRYWSNANAGFSASKMFLSFGIVFAAGGLLLSYFASRIDFELAPTELIVHRMWSLQEEHHPYSHISALKEAVDAKDQRSNFIIEFSDAEPWSTAQEVIFPEAEHKAYLEKMTGKRIETVSE